MTLCPSCKKQIIDRYLHEVYEGYRVCFECFWEFNQLRPLSPMSLINEHEICEAIHEFLKQKFGFSYEISSLDSYSDDKWINLTFRIAR